MPRTSPEQRDDLALGMGPDLDRTDRTAFGSADEIEACTNRLLARHVRYCYERSRFYRRRFEDAGLTPRDIRCTTDLSALPFTTKADLAEHADALLCVGHDQVVDVCQTSGTTGAPVSLLQTERDLQRLAYNERLCFLAAGLTSVDRVVVACALGRCFMAGLAYFEGLRSIGATAVRVGAGSPSMLAEAVLTHAPSGIVGVPSFLLETARVLAQRGVDPSGLGVRRLICIGEPIRNDDLSLSDLGRRLSHTWAAKVLGTYASTEMATSFAECDCGRGGGHVHPDLIAVEIIDENDNPVEPGRPGEVVATPLQVTGMPLLRLKTGDIATLRTESCACGRNTFRIGPVLGRKAQMLKVRGTTVYPTAIFAALQGIEEVCGYYLEVEQDYTLSDRARVVVALRKGACVTGEQIAERLRGRIRVKLDVTVASPDEVRSKTVQEGRRKPVRVFDYRTKKIGEADSA